MKTKNWFMVPLQNRPGRAISVLGEKFYLGLPKMYFHGKLFLRGPLTRVHLISGWTLTQALAGNAPPTVRGLVDEKMSGAFGSH